MKKGIFLFTFFLLEYGLHAQDNTRIVLKDKKDSASFLLGYGIYSLWIDNLGTVPFPFDFEKIAKGFKAGVDSTFSIPWTIDSIGQYLDIYLEMADSHNENLKTKYTAINARYNDSFLAVNGIRPGVTTNIDGSQYEILKAGTGNKPIPKGYVTYRYTSSWTDGTIRYLNDTFTIPVNVFPSSYYINFPRKDLKKIKEGTILRTWITIADVDDRFFRKEGYVHYDSMIITDIEIIKYSKEADLSEVDLPPPPPAY